MKHHFAVATLFLCSTIPAVAAPGIKGGSAPFQNEVSITVEGDVRIIKSNGIPNHETGQFPGKGNPNTISPQSYEFHVPANPKIADKTTGPRMGPFGIAVNGVVFDPGAAEWWQNDRNSGWQYEPLKMAPLYLGTDASHAHVQPNGSYHYHGIPTALVHALTDGKDKTVLVGWAGDGFPIYNTLGLSNPKDPASPLKPLTSSYRVKKGTRPNGPGGPYDGKFLADYEFVQGAGDLDECNGLTSPTPEYPNGIYHYVLTEEFPYVPRIYRGTPDPSFLRRPPAGGPNPAGGQGRIPANPPAPNNTGGIHLIPRYAQEQVNLTEDQRTKITQLELETKDKLAKILTPEQMNALNEARPPRGPSGAGPGGPNEGPGPGRSPGGADHGPGGPPNQ